MQSLRKQRLKATLRAIRSFLIATLLGLFVGMLVILLAGYNPLVVYKEMFSKSFFKPFYLSQSLTRAMPIIMASLATIISWRAGYINIGVEGQMIMGGLAASTVAIYMEGPSFLVFILALLAGLLAGALYALLAAVLNIYFNVSIVISTLMFNYIASYLASYFVNFPLRDRSGDGLAAQTVSLDESLHLPKLGEHPFTFNTAYIVVIIVLLLYLFYEKNLVFGYESKMTGLNPNFAKYGGVKEIPTLLKTMALSGAIAGLAAFIEIFAVKYRFVDGMFTSTSYAWTALMAALIANLHPIGSFFVSIFLAGLQVGGQSIQRSFSIPLEMSTVIQASITLFVSVKLAFKLRRKRKTDTKDDQDSSGEIDSLDLKEVKDLERKGLK